MKFKTETTKTLILFVPKTLYEFLECFDYSFEFAISDFLEFRKTVTNALLFLDDDNDFSDKEKAKIKKEWIKLNTIVHQNEFDQVLIRRQI